MGLVGVVGEAKEVDSAETIEMGGAREGIRSDGTGVVVYSGKKR